MGAAASTPKPISLPRELLHTLTADPPHLPELLAAFAVEHLAGPAGRTVTQLREQQPDASPGDLQSAVTTRGRRRCQTEGSFVGGPFILLVPVAFCAALLEQLRMALEIGCLAGHDPSDPERVAELLVLQGVYPDTAQARAALSAVSQGKHHTSRKDRRKQRTDWAVVSRMARLLGLITPDDAESKPSLLARIGQWVLLILLLLVGTVAPLVWMPYLAFSYHRSTDQLARRAIHFYFGDRTTPGPRKGEHTQLGITAGLLRALLTLIIPVGAVVTAVLLNLRIADSHWPVIGIVLISVSTITGIAWYIRHRRRATSKD